uniref:Uncharacterized protein n=1 Tax=uncultured prokaryote TaxID=198431 RepID=A0A0H5Q3Z5_9ZZZZ|nr:hypothetical protein [uncultured prokaryote]
MAKQKKQTDNPIHPLLYDIEKEVWWHLSGKMCSLTLKGVEDNRYTATLTAVNQKGTKYYAIVEGSTVAEALDRLECFLATGNKGYGKWRVSKW